MKKTPSPLILTLAFVLGVTTPADAYRDLETGSFITPDPAGFVDGPNRYTYVRQNPWTKFDPEGLLETTITNAQAVKLKDSAPFIEAKINKAIAEARENAQRMHYTPERASEELRNKLSYPSGPYGNDTKLAQEVRRQGAGYAIKGAFTGSRYDGVPLSGMPGDTVGYPAVFVLAHGINIKGQAVGTDKHGPYACHRV